MTQPLVNGELEPPTEGQPRLHSSSPCLPSRPCPPCDEGFTQEKHQWTSGVKAAAGLGAGRRPFGASARLRQAKQKSGLPV